MRKRLAIAGGLVAVALAAIPLLESFSGSEKSAASTTTGSSGRIVSKEEPSVASAPTLVIAQLPEESSAPASSAPATSPSGNSRPAAPTPGSPLPATPAPGSTTAPTDMPPAAKPALATNPAPATRPAPPATISPSPKPAQTPLATQKTAPAAAAQPAPPLATSAQTIPKVMPNLAGNSNGTTSLGYQVQLGLFSSSMNAEKLVADLKKQGLTARTETRVQLGPFRTRAEAEEAMQRLRELGYQPMLVPIGTR